MNLWPVEHFVPHFRVHVVLEVPQSEEKSVQLVRGTFFRSDFLQNTYFSNFSSPWLGMYFKEGFGINFEPFEVVFIVLSTVVFRFKHVQI